MKTGVFISLFLTIMFNLSAGAKENINVADKENTAPNRTREIVVSNDLSVNDIYKLFDKVLTKNNFIVQLKDNTTNTLKVTTKENYRKKIITYLLSLSIKDKEITVTGKYSTDISVGLTYDQTNDSKFKKIVNQGMKKSVSRLTFNKMLSFSKLFGGSLKFIAD